MGGVVEMVSEIGEGMGGWCCGDGECDWGGMGEWCCGDGD